MTYQREPTTNSLLMRPLVESYIDSLDKGERRRFQPTLSQLTRLLGEDLTLPNRSLLADLPGRLRRHLREDGLSANTVADYSKRTQRAIRFIVDHHPDLQGLDQLPPAFPVLVPDQDDQQHRFWKGYDRFRDWCVKQGIGLDEVNKGVFRDYQSHLLAGYKYLVARNYYSALISFWQTRADRWELPTMEIPPMNRKGPGRYGLARSSWPKQIQDDFEQFFRHSRFEKRISDSPPKSFRDQAAEKAYSMVLSGYLGYLAQERQIDLARLGLREVLSNEKWVLDYIDWHKTERSDGKDANIHQRTFERFAIILEEMWDDPIAKTYREYVNQIVPVRKAPRFSETMVPFRDLLTAGFRALQDARLECDRVLSRGGSTSSAREATKAAVQFHNALLFALLIQRPIREANLIDLFLGEGLVKKIDRHYELIIRAVEEKGKKLYRIPFPAGLEEPLDYYLKHCRPLLNRKGEQRVFMTSRGGRLTPKLLGDRTAALGKRYLGIDRMNPHFFRALVVSSYLADYPNQFETVRQLLGHKSLDTTLRHYIHVHALHASRRAAQFARDTCEEFRGLGTVLVP